MELSLFKRELIELAQRKRTYGLRCLVWLVFLIVFLIAYIDLTTYAANMLQMLGRGNQITEALFITLILTIYVLNPIMACTAITSEKEKQTLGLLIVSKLTPTSIVVEKIASRMLPLVSLLLVSAPLFAVAYLFGGVTFTHTLVGLFILFSTILQVTTIAVFCSALFESGIAAFWGTYLLLGLLYFTLPMMREFHLIRIDFGSLPDEEFMFFPIYQLAMLMNTGQSYSDILLLTLPNFIVTIVFAFAARWAVVKFSFGSAFAFAKQANVVRKEVAHWLRQLWENRPRSLTIVWPNQPMPEVEAAKPVASPASLQPDPRMESRCDDSARQAHETTLQQSWLLQRGRPIAWRELRGKLVSSRMLQVSCLAGLLLFELSWMANQQHDTEEISAVVSIGLLIVAVLLVLGFSCRLFATERERQTLDSLLVAPLTNTELLRQKLAGVNRLIVLLLVPLFVLGVINMLNADIDYGYPEWTIGGVTGRGALRNRTRLIPGQFVWFWHGCLFLTCIVGSAFIYLNLAKWIAIYWGLKLNTQMKALLASVLCVIALCLVPMMTCLGYLFWTDADPDSTPLFFFSSPAIIVCMNEIHELYYVYRRGSFPPSDWLVVLTNFAIYGSLALVLRAVLLRRLPKLLNRPEHASKALT